MAVGSGSDAPHSRSSLTCATHDYTRVALYCQTCEKLICTRCISHGPSGNGEHREHFYLDLADAYDIVREKIEKKAAVFKEELQSRKNERKKVHTTVQKLRFELLRKRTQVSGRTRSLRDTLRQREQHYQRAMEQLLQPAISRNEEVFAAIEYDVVSREGLLGSVESILKTPPEKPILFLQNAASATKEMEEKLMACVPLTADSGNELANLQRSSLGLHREKKMLAHAFDYPHNAPRRPWVLTDWCSVGATSATVTWKFHKADSLSQFVLYFRPVQKADRKYQKLASGQQEKEWKQRAKDKREQRAANEALQKSQMEEENLSSEETSEDTPEASSIQHESEYKCNAVDETNKCQEVAGVGNKPTTLKTKKKRKRLPNSLPIEVNNLCDVDAHYEKLVSQSGVDIKEFSSVKIRKFISGRTTAVLRNLQPATEYVLRLVAENAAGSSSHEVVYFTTLSNPSKHRNDSMRKKLFQGPGMVSRHMEPTTNPLWWMMKWMTKMMFWMLIFGSLMLCGFLLWRFHRVLLFGVCQYFAPSDETSTKSALYHYICPEDLPQSIDSYMDQLVFHMTRKPHTVFEMPYNDPSSSEFDDLMTDHVESAPGYKNFWFDFDFIGYMQQALFGGADDGGSIE